jgi:hypothetical protein
MSTQTVLWHDTIYDALAADINGAGGFKVVAGKLWPADSSGPTKLRNAVNPGQPHKLTPDEILQIKRLAYEHGSTATVDFEAQQLGYVCTWVDPEDESEQLGREIRDLLEAVNRKLDRKAKAEERAGLRSVK